MTLPRFKCTDCKWVWARGGWRRPCPRCGSTRPPHAIHEDPFGRLVNELPLVPPPTPANP